MAQTQVFDIRLHNFWVGMEQGGTYRLEVYIDHPKGQWDNCHTRKKSSKAELQSKVVGAWWSSWDIDMMYETKYCSTTHNHGWAETDTGLLAKTVTICVSGNGISGIVQYPLFLMITGPRCHALKLFDGSRPCGVVYYMAQSLHKGAAGEGLTISLQKFALLASHNLSAGPVKGEWDWHGHSIQTPEITIDPYNDPTDDPIDLADGRGSIYNKGESIDLLLDTPFTVRMYNGSDILWKKVSLGEYVTSIPQLNGTRPTSYRGKPESRTAFSVELSAGGKSCWVFLQLQILNLPKYTQMKSGVLTHDSEGGLMIHFQAFGEPSMTWPCTDQRNLLYWYDAKDPAPLVWGFPIPTDENNEPYKIVRKDGLKVAEMYNEAWYLRPFEKYPLPQDWSCHEFTNPTTGEVSYYFRDHHPESREVTWTAPPMLPPMWCARVSPLPEHRGEKGALLYFYPEDDPSKTQWDPPRCFRGFCAVACPPNVRAVTVPSGPHKGKVFYQEKHGSATTTGWVPPNTSLAEEMRGNDHYALECIQEVPVNSHPVQQESHSHGGNLVSHHNNAPNEFSAQVYQQQQVHPPTFPHFTFSDPYADDEV
eukprot:TRINITY_DN24087_c0_g1_i1.p1 TRINITY_DN24087_c0_g1~~TRINITY_DN24087_c0_g1_i1.p1  ORF type:complete len:649 (+),score=76.94 TRINITY_DN24087_c0_g1_i1:177-1949(+)